MVSTMVRRGPVSARARDGSLGEKRQRRRRAARFDLQFHSTWTRGFFGFGRRVCMCCGKRWGEHGCADRATALELFVALATKTELRQAVRERLLTASEAGIQEVAERAAEPRFYGDPSGLMGAMVA